MKERYPIITYECLLKEAGFQDKKRKDIEQALMHMKQDIQRISGVVETLEKRPKAEEKHALEIIKNHSDELK